VTDLGQQSLLAPPGPPRTVKIPADWPASWGMDSATKRLAVGSAQTRADGSVRRDVHMVRYAEGYTDEDAHREAGQRLAIVEARTMALLEAMLDAGVPAPGHVMLEQPFGGNAKSGKGPRVDPVLQWTVGVIGATTYRFFRQRLGYVVHVELLNVMTWKAQIGCGGAKGWKPTHKRLGRKPELADYGIAQWAFLNGFEETGEPSDWDKVDAMGMAEANRRMVGFIR